MLDWEAFRKYESEMHDVESCIIDMGFLEFIKGNSAYDDMSSPEVESHHLAFRTGWIISQLLSKR